MPSTRILSSAFVILLLAGCSGDRRPASVDPQGGGAAPSTGAQPGSASGEKGPLRIEPAEVYRGTPVRLSPAASLPAGAAIEWLVNGAAVRGGGAPAIDTAQLRKGDTIQARSVIAGGTAVSQVVTVRNTPPEIRSVRFVLGGDREGSTIGVEAEGFDADGDAVQFEISWRKNGDPAGTGDRLGSPVMRGDKVEVTITPFDGEARGRGAALSREIRNTPPVIEGQEQFQVSESVVTFLVRARDADGDTLTYSLTEAPAGMRIDRTTGWVRWETPPGTTGKVPFAVTAADGSGGEATARFSVTIAREPLAGER